MYGGDKNIVIVEGDHNSPRPKFLYDSAAIFLLTTLQVILFSFLFSFDSAVFKSTRC